MTTPNSTPPGWYPNPRGQSQWWDGRQWGPLAPGTPPAPLVPAAQRAPVVYVQPQKDVGIAYLLAILLGGLGAHRFYLGRIGTAVAFIILWIGGALLLVFIVGFFMMFAAFVWWVIDLIRLPSMVRDTNNPIDPPPGYPAVTR